MAQICNDCNWSKILHLLWKREKIELLQYKILVAAWWQRSAQVHCFLWWVEWAHRILQSMQLLLVYSSLFSKAVSSWYAFLFLTLLCSSWGENFSNSAYITVYFFHDKNCRWDKSSLSLKVKMCTTHVLEACFWIWGSKNMKKISRKDFSLMLHCPSSMTGLEHLSPPPSQTRIRSGAISHRVVWDLSCSF